MYGFIVASTTAIFLLMLNCLMLMKVLFDVRKCFFVVVSFKFGFTLFMDTSLLNLASYVLKHSFFTPKLFRICSLLE